MKRIEKRPGCIASTLKVVGDKWTSLILKELHAGNNRFNILQLQVKGISSRTLSQRLDLLEMEGIVEKKKYAQIPPRVEYTLTKKGQELLPIIKQMAQWGEKYHV